MKDTKSTRDTKEKIICAASSLFSQKGLLGTSMRDIAKEAEVNVALINYHFKTKDNLYTHVCISNSKKFESAVIDLINEKNLDIYSFADVFYDLLLDLKQEVKNHFMSRFEASFDEGTLKEHLSEYTFNPFAILVRKELGDDASEDVVRWVGKTLMSHLTGQVLFFTSNFGEAIKNVVPAANPEFMRATFPILIKALISYAKDNGQQIEQKFNEKKKEICADYSDLDQLFKVKSTKALSTPITL